MSPAPAGSRRTCAVASPHAAATDAAVRAVEQGGNALDAALAAAVTLTVVYPHNTSLGGDLFALVHVPDGRIVSVNASGRAPSHVDAAAVAARHGGRMPVRGADTVTVPGAVAGLGAVHSLGARLPWGAHMEAASGLASDGVPVAPGLGRAIDEELQLVLADAGLRAVFAPGDRPLRPGEKLLQPRLAETLERIAAGGAGAFYEGGLAHRLVDGLRAHGSEMDAVDFASYVPSVDGGLRRTFKGCDVWTAGPNSQGFLLLAILQGLELLGCDDPLGADAGTLSALFALAIEVRERALADPDAMTEGVDALLDPERWSSLLDRLDRPDRPDRRDRPDGHGRGRAVSSGPAGAAAPAAAEAPRPRGDTVAVVAADNEGWAVSLIQSLFHSFGSGILDERSGVIFHNRGALFSLDERSPNMLAPGKRPAHTLMPVLVRDGGRLRWVMGTMGGRAQPQIHAQVLTRLLDGTEPAVAVAAPRWIVERQNAAEVAAVERDVPSRAREAVAGRMGVLGLPHLDETVGHAQVVALDHPENGNWSAGSDPRADGTAAVVTVAAGGGGLPGWEPPGGSPRR
jgi:gamma-glutamyltranspeptidase